MSELYSSIDGLLQWRFHVKQRQLNAQQKVQALLGGSHHALRKGRGMEFSEVRQYQAGDDIRHIDWRVSARTQKVHTKLFTEELERPVVCVIEQTPHLFFGSQIRFKTSQALNLMSLIGWSTLNHKDRFGALVFNHLNHHWTEPKHHVKPLMQAFQQAVSLQSALNKPKINYQDHWKLHLSHLQKHLRPGSKLFLIGDALQWQQPHFSQLQTLRRHTDITVIHLYDELELNLPDIGLAKLSDGQNEIQINARDHSLHQAYSQTYQQEMESLQQALHRLKIPLAKISAQAHPLEALVQQGILK